jgi:glycosyltransferase involved in cell wall biosynthesis
MLGGFGTFPRKDYKPPEKSRLGIIHKAPKPPEKIKSRLGFRQSSRPARPIRPFRPAVLRGKPGPREGIAIVGQFASWHWGQHPDESYLADAIESLGVPVYRIQQGWQGSVVRECAWALFTSQPSSWNRMYRWSKTHGTVLWTLDWLPDYPDRREIINAACRANVFVSSDQYNWKANYGIQNHLYLPGACESVNVAFEPRPRRPCAFMGSIYNARRTAIARIIEKLGGEVRGAPGTWLYGRDLAKYVQETKVIVGDNYRNDVPGYWSTRNYVIPGAGGVLLTSRVPGLEKDFEIGTHIAVYDTPGEIEEAIALCITRDAEREAMRRAGFEHVRAHHNWQTRARVLLKALGIKTIA